MQGTIYDRITTAVAELTAIAARIECPDGKGGQVAAQIKADLLLVVGRLADELKPTPPLVFPGV